MSKYNMTQISNKQELLDIHIKSLKKMNNLLVQIIIEGDADDEYVMAAIKDICKDIKDCAKRIGDTSCDISNYIIFNGVELAKYKQPDPGESKWEEAINNG